MSILDTIDGALRDYETSGDAMRWTPEEKSGIPVRDGISVDIDIDTADFDAALEAFSRSMDRAAEAITRMFGAVKSAVESTALALGQMGHSMHLSLHPGQHKRCVTCHPWRKPKPLAVNGHEYQRRLKARLRRNRR